MSKPIIGIVANFYDRAMSRGHAHSRLNAEYSDAVAQAGGLPVILPPVEDRPALEQFLDSVDGLLFGGGYDISPQRYGRQRHPKTEVLAQRLEPFIFAVFELADRRAELPLPVLGICLGIQVFNVARGGTLHQHLPDVDRPHRLDHFSQESQYTGGRVHHVVRIKPGSRLAEILGGRTEIQTNSGHHQAIDRVGRGLIVTARSSDGVVEAVEDPSRPLWLAVQWHPEDLADQPEHLALFQALVTQASRKRSR